MGNYFNDLCYALEKAGGFKIKKIIREDDYGMLNENNKTWSGAVGLVVDEKVDIALGFFTILPSELLVLDYTARLITSEYVIIIRKPESTVLVLWSAYFRVKFNFLQLIN